MNEIRDYGNIQVQLRSENGDLVKTCDSPRLVIAVLAIQVGMTEEDVNRLLQNNSDAELQQIINRIKQEGFLENSNEQR